MIAEYKRSGALTAEALAELRLKSRVRYLLAMIFGVLVMAQGLGSRRVIRFHLGDVVGGLRK
jgi:hypothetical protein